MSEVRLADAATGDRMGANATWVVEHRRQFEAEPR